MLVHVFGTTFEYHFAPSFVQYAIRLRTARWGTNLDTTAPVAARVAVFQLARKFAIPGTPI